MHITPGAAADSPPHTLICKGAVMDTYGCIVLCTGSAGQQTMLSSCYSHQCCQQPCAPAAAPLRKLVKICSIVPLPCLECAALGTRSTYNLQAASASGAPGAAAADCGSALNSSTSALSCVDGAALGGKSTCGSAGAPLSSGAACDATAESTVNSSTRRLVSSSRILSRYSSTLIQQCKVAAPSFGEYAEQTKVIATSVPALTQGRTAPGVGLVQLALGQSGKLVEQLCSVGHIRVHQRERALVWHGGRGVLCAQPLLAIGWHAALAKAVLWRASAVLPPGVHTTHT